MSVTSDPGGFGDVEKHPMTIYGESMEQFRPRPSLVALGFTSLAAVLISVVATSLLVSLLQLAIRLALEPATVPFLFVPFGSSPYFPAGTPAAARAILGSMFACAALAALSVRLWPTEQTLASRLFVYLLSTVLVTAGCLAPALSAGTFEAVAAATSVVTLAWMVLIVAIASFVLFRLQRNLSGLMSNFFSMLTPWGRLVLWSVMIAPGFLLVAGICLLSGYRAGAYAFLAAGALTAFECLSHVPQERFETLSEPHLREPAATLPLIAAALIGVSLYYFGSPLIGKPPSVMLFGKARPEFVDLEKTSLNRKPETEDEKKAKTEIRWSKDKKKKK